MWNPKHNFKRPIAKVYSLLLLDSMSKGALPDSEVTAKKYLNSISYCFFFSVVLMVHLLVVEQKKICTKVLL